MDQSKITVRYAKAFFELAQEKQLAVRLKSDMELVLSVAQTSADFVLLLESPVVKASQKEKAMRAIFANHLHETSLRFLNLIISNKREVHIPGICRNFLQLIRQEQGIRTAVITSASELSDNALNQINTMLEKEFNAPVETSQKVNPDLIGGFILRVDDQQFDASVASRLRKVKEALLQTEIK